MPNNFKSTLHLMRVASLILVMALFFGCKKNQVGGKAVLKGVVSHHGAPISNAYVYIKYNALEFPGVDYTLYDTYVIADNEGNYTVNLYKGKYYIFAKGYDFNIPAPYIVSGGLSVNIRNREKLTKDVPVSED